MKRSTLNALARKSLADVTRRKGRTLLVVLGILIGVSGLTAINVAAGTIGGAFAYSASRAAYPDLSITVQGVDPALAAQLQAVPNVKIVQISSFYRSRWQVRAAPGHVNLNIYAFDDISAVKLNPFQITSGRLPGAGEIVLDASDRALQSFALGDTITVNTPHGPTGVRVVGTSRTLGWSSASFSNRAVGYASGDGLRQLTGLTQDNVIDVRVNQKRDEKATLQALLGVLHAHSVSVFDASVIDDAWSPGPLDGVFAIMRVLSGIALVLTSFLIINTVTTLVAEQTAIIGTMKAIGGTRGTIVRSYLFSVGVYGIMGTVLGVVLGVWGGYLFAMYLTSIITLDIGPFALDPGVVVLSVIVGLGVPFAAALLPLWNGTRITVREALAGYGVSSASGGNGGARRQPVRRATALPWVSQTTWLGLRGLFRRRGRAALTLLALTLAGAAFMAIQTTTYAFSLDLSQIFSQYDADAFVGITPQPYQSVRATLLSVPNVARIERFEQTYVTLKGRTLLLTGVEPDARLYHHTVLAGRWLAGDETDVAVISDNLAHQTNLKVGDVLSFSGSTNSASWRIIGEIHDSNGGLGTVGSAFTTISNLHAFEGIPADIGSSFMVQATDRSSAAVNQMATTLDDTLSRGGLAPSISTAQQQIQRNQNQFQILYALLYGVAVIVGLVGVLGLFNTLTTSVLERRREIGILRSMGASGGRVASIFWTEGMALAGIAWLVALVVGIPAAYGFIRLIGELLVPVPFTFNPVTLVATLVVILVIATLASIIPALSAARVRIAATLRYE